MPKISAAGGPSYAGVVDSQSVSYEDYRAAQERVTKGNAEDGDGALIARYDMQSARARAVDLHAAPPEIAERASADASIKSADPNASAERIDPETGQPRLTDEGAEQLGIDLDEKPAVEGGQAEQPGDEQGEQRQSEQRPPQDDRAPEKAPSAGRRGRTS